MSPKQDEFVRQYLVDLNATQAAIRAGYSPKTANEQGSRLLANVSVRSAIEAAKAERAKRTGITADEVLLGFAAIARADARELIEFRRGCCRYCWGEGFRYQRTAGEMDRDREVHAEMFKGKKNAPAFDEKGGIGYHAKRDPNPECPECFGDGIGEAFIRDTRNVSPEAARLYAGVKQTKEGIEVKMHSIPDALLQMGRHLGLFREKVEHSGPDGKPLQAAAPVFNVTVKG